MDRKRILEIAMASELEALEGYLALAGAARGSGARDMFIHLAQDELMHYRLLRSQVDGDEARQKVRAGSEAWTRIIQDLPKGRRSNTRGREHIDSLKLALKMEREAEDRYRKRAGASDGDEAEVWLGLAEMEKAHAHILERQIEEIEDSGSWLDLSEVWQRPV